MADEAFLDYIKGQREKLMAELRDLEAAERVYRSQGTVNGSAEQASGTETAKKRPPKKSRKKTATVAGVTRMYEHCEKILNDLRVVTKTADIAKLIVEHGCAKASDTLKTQIFTAMRRKKDVFFKTADGWGLVAWNKKQ